MDLEIRAAKALTPDFVVHPNGGGVLIAVDICKLLDVPTLIHVDDLKFTTSYDWAMLGVKEGYEKYGDDFKYKMMIQFGILGVKDNYQATPEQITQAWVEVLENAT